MKIIIDSGATKSDWRLVSEQGAPIQQIILGGMNVSAMKAEAVQEIIAQAASAAAPALSADPVSSIHMYIAGVITPEISEYLQEALQPIAKGAPIELQIDLIGACRAACGHGAGIAAILGTGSNSCQFDGTKVVKQVRSGGFILGDEGSAATLGKLFIADFLKGIVPPAIAEEFSARYPSDYMTIVEQVYRSKTSPSGYLGSFAPFILEHYSDPYIKQLVDGNFKAFIDRCLCQYDTSSLKVGIVGGFGAACKHIIEPLAAAAGVEIAGFYANPTDRLIEYHCGKV